MIKQARTICEKLGVNVIYGTYMGEESKNFYLSNSFEIDEEKRQFKVDINHEKMKK